MPIKLKDEVFPMPGEDNTPNATGREIIAIEDHFALDGLELLTVLEDWEKLHTNPAYSRIKALYALAWIVLTRSGKILSIDDVLNTYSVSDIQPIEVEAKKEQTADDSTTAAQE